MSAIVLRGDARHLPLPDASVDLIVTSPPYFGLRSYTDAGEHYDGQIGSETTPAEWLASLLDCTRDWMRVLKPSGSMWVNLGDKYAGSQPSAARWHTATLEGGRGRLPELAATHSSTADVGWGDVREKSLLGLPWRYALACIDQLGLILRAEVIWSKPNGLPESVTDRVRRSHEQWFHLTMQPRYYSAVDEIREPHQPQSIARTQRNRFAPDLSQTGVGSPNTLSPGEACNPLGKLPGSVWTIPTQPLTVPPGLGVGHFAAFPMEWPRRIIQGWSPAAICAVCGEGRRPVIASVALDLSRPQARKANELAERAGLTEQHFGALLAIGVSDTGRGAATQSGTGKNTPEQYRLAAEARAVLGGYAREYLLRRPTSFTYVCACGDDKSEVVNLSSGRPSVVVDPFGGTGTTALIASVLGRTGISVDRSADYCRLAQWRTTDPGERARAMQVPKPPPVPDGQGSLFDAGEATA